MFEPETNLYNEYIKAQKQMMEDIKLAFGTKYVASHDVGKTHSMEDAYKLSPLTEAHI